MDRYPFEERKRGISIKLGYADTAFYKTKDGQYYATGRHPDGKDDVEKELEHVISFVDAPGHETLMAIMITGASIMDGAMLMVAANEACPQPQTREHLMALEIAGIENIVVVQNKIDLVTKETRFGILRRNQRIPQRNNCEKTPPLFLFPHIMMST